MARSTRDELTTRLLAEVVPGPAGGSAVALLGVGGIGKSTLLNRVADQLGQVAVRVVRARAVELDAHEPFATVRFLLDGEPSDPVNAALETVDAWCAQGPVVICVDDAHHLDAASAAVLSRVARATRDLPLSLLVSARPNRSPDLLTVLELCKTRIDLAPLDGEDLVTLVRQRLGVPPGPSLRRELSVAGGNPFAITVLLDLLEYREALVRDDDEVDVIVDGTAALDSAAAAVRALLSRLPGESREILTAVAVLGTPALPEDIAALAGQPVARLGSSLREAVEAGVVRWEGGYVVFGHDLFADTLVQDLPAPVRSAMHRSAVGVLQKRNAPVRQVAHHAWRGGNVADVPLLRSLAADLTDFAPGVAAQLLEKVQPLIDRADTDEVVVQRARAMLQAGRGRDAEDLLRSYLPRATSPELRFQMHDLIMSSMVHRAHTAGVMAEVDNLLAVGGLPPDAVRDLIGLRAWVLLLDGHLEAAAEVDRQLASAVPAPAERSEVATVLMWLHGRAREALELELAGVEDVDNAGPVFPALFALYSDGPERAEQLNKQWRAVSVGADARFVSEFHDYVLGNICFMAGRWDDAEAAVNAGLEMGEESGSMGLSAPLGALSLIASHQGRLRDARDHLARIEKGHYPAQFGRDYAAFGRAFLAEAEAVDRLINREDGADWDSGLDIARDEYAELWSAALERGGELWMLTVAADVMRLASDEVRRSVVSTLRRYAPGQLPMLDPVREQVLGMEARDSARVAAAADSFSKVSHPLAAALAWEEAGLIAAAAGGSTKAGAYLRNAVEMYAGLGATCDADRLRARAQRLGIRTSRSRARRETLTGWDALTPTETTVAGLVRQGLSNPEIAKRLFLSPRTVQTHVSHILQKLQMRSRVEIASMTP